MELNTPHYSLDIPEREILLVRGAIEKWSSEVRSGIVRQSVTDSRDLDRITVNRKILKRFSTLELQYLVAEIFIMKGLLLDEYLGVFLLLIQEEEPRMRQDPVREIFSNTEQGLLPYFLSVALRANHPSKFHGVLNQKKRHQGKKVTNLELFLSSYPYFIWVPKPRKPQRKRGYSDQGTLGSSLSITLKDQSRDILYLENIKKKKMEELKEQQDLAQLLEGYLF